MNITKRQIEKQVCIVSKHVNKRMLLRNSRDIFCECIQLFLHNKLLLMFLGIHLSMTSLRWWIIEEPYHVWKTHVTLLMKSWCWFFCYWDKNDFILWICSKNIYVKKFHKVLPTFVYSNLKKSKNSNFILQNTPQVVSNQHRS
jgi:hypothetical protein